MVFAASPVANFLVSVSCSLVITGVIPAASNAVADSRVATIASSLAVWETSRTRRFSLIFPPWPVFQFSQSILTDLVARN